MNRCLSIDELEFSEEEKIEKEWIINILNPDKKVLAIIHDGIHETGVSYIESKIITDLITTFYEKTDTENIEEEERFWTHKVGIVAVHNAQGRLIVREIYDSISNLSSLADERLYDLIKKTINRLSESGIIDSRRKERCRKELISSIYERLEKQIISQVINSKEFGKGIDKILEKNIPPSIIIQEILEKYFH